WRGGLPKRRSGAERRTGGGMRHDPHLFRARPRRRGPDPRQPIGRQRGRGAAGPVYRVLPQARRPCDARPVPPRRAPAGLRARGGRVVGAGRTGGRARWERRRSRRRWDDGRFRRVRSGGRLLSRFRYRTVRAYATDALLVATRRAKDLAIPTFERIMNSWT